MLLHDLILLVDVDKIVRDVKNPLLVSKEHFLLLISRRVTNATIEEQCTTLLGNTAMNTFVYSRATWRNSSIPKSTQLHKAMNASETATVSVKTRFAEGIIVFATSRLKKKNPRSQVHTQNSDYMQQNHIISTKLAERIYLIVPVSGRNNAYGVWQSVT